MKRIFKILVVLLIALTIYACNGKTVDLELDPPTNVAINNGVVTWTAVSGIEEYVVVVGTQQYTVTTTEFNLNTLTLSSGTYPIHVLSKKGDTVSLPSNTVNFIVEEETIVTDLGVPQNVTLVNGVLSWSAVTGADSYVVTVGSETYPVTTLSLDLNTLTLPTGSYPVFVRAKSGALLSNSSITQTFIVAPIVTVGLVETLLKMIDPEYEEDLTMDDFDNEWDYREYINTSLLVNAFAYSTNHIGMTDLEIIGMFTEVMFMVGEMEEIDGPMMLFVMLDIFDMGLDNEDLTFVLLNLAGVALDIMHDERLFDIAVYEVELLTLQTEFATLQANANVLFDLLEANTPTEYLPELEAFIDTIFDNDLYYLLDIISNTIIPFISNNEENPYFFDYHDNAELFYNIFVEMKENNPVAFGNFANNVWGQFNPVMELSWKYNELQWTYENIGRAQDNIEMILAFQELWTDQTELVEQFVENTLDYIKDLSLVIDMEMFSFLNSGAFTMEEVFVLKDELVEIFLDTLPDVEAFETLYELLFVITSAMTDTNMDAFVPYASFLAAVDRQMIELILLFADSVDQATFIEFMDLASNLEVETYIEDEWGGYYTYSPNIENVVELMLLVLNHIDQFYTDQAVKIEAFNTLVDSQTLRSFTVVLFNQLKLTLANELDEEESEFAIMIIDEILLDLDYYYLNFKKLSGLTVDLLKEFMATEGEIVFNIMSISSLGEFEEATIGIIQDIFGSILGYTTIMNEAMDLESIENLLALARIPLKVMVMMEEVPIEDFDLMFEELLPLFAELIFNIGMLEQRITTVLSTTTNGSLLFTNAWDLEFELQVMLVVTYIIDEIFTPTYYDLVFDTIDLVFDEIAVQADLADLLSGMEVLPADIKLMLVDLITQKFEAIDDVLLIDFTAPTQQDIELLLSIFDFLMGQDQEDPMIVN